MSKKKVLWVVTELFYPDETSTAYIMTSIVERIVEDREVHVICGPSSYQDSALRSNKKLNEHIHLHRTATLNLDKNHLFSRIIKFVILSFQLSMKLLFKASKGEDVFIVTNPAPIVLLVSFIARIRGLNLTILVHDVFPENLVAVDFIKTDSLKYKFLRHIFNAAYSHAHHLIVLGRDMHEIMNKKVSYKKRPPKISIIENWADTEAIKPEDKAVNELRISIDLSRKIVFQFAGNLGRLQGLIELFEVIKQVKNPHVHFLVIGEGALKNEIEAFVKNNKLTNTTLLPSFPRHQQNSFLNCTDVGIVSLASKMFGLGVPSKSYNIAAAGKPILYIGPENSEIYNFIKENEIGWCFTMAEKEKLIDFFEALDQSKCDKITGLGIKAREVVVNKYSMNSILNKFNAVFK